MPYGYFQLVRFIGMVGFIALAYIDKENKQMSITIFWIFSAVLINPLFKVSLGRTIWNFVDIFWAFVLLSSIIVESLDNKRKI